MTYTVLPPAHFSFLTNVKYITSPTPFISQYPIFVVDDESVVCFTENAFGYELLATVYDISGKFTSYGFFNKKNDYVVNILPFGFGRFLISLNSGIQIIQQFSNAKLNNPVPITMYQKISISTPCYGPPTEYFYDNEKQILGCVAYEPSGQNGGPVYDAEYKVTENGLYLLSSGYTGDYYSPTNTDPYNKTNVNFTGTVESLYRNQTNSIQTALFLNSGSYFIGTNVIGVNVGISTNCNQTQQKTGSYSYSKNSSSNIILYTYNYVPPTLDSNIPGITGAYTPYGLNESNYQKIELYYNNNLFFLPTPAPPTTPNFIAMTNKYIFFLGYNYVSLYVSEYSFNNPLNNINQFIPSNQPVLLTNFHRPVSILGKYKA